MIPLLFTLPYLTELSINHAYGRSQHGGVFKKKIVVLWGTILKATINSALPFQYGPEMLGVPPFVLNIKVHFARKLGNTSGDAPNYDKIIRDVVAVTLGVNDVGTTGTPEATYGNRKNQRIDVDILLNVKDEYLALFDPDMFRKVIS